MDEGLLHKKLRTLEQQRAQSDDLNALLTREGGLNESQHMTCKNLKAAVAVSKQPGFSSTTSIARRSSAPTIGRRATRW